MPDASDNRLHYVCQDGRRLPLFRCIGDDRHNMQGQQERYMGELEHRRVPTTMSQRVTTLDVVLAIEDLVSCLENSNYLNS
jgi:hypothetical protein